MTFDELKERIDFEAVAKAVLGGLDKFPEGEFEDAKRIVWALCENYLARDVREFALEEPEQKLLITGLPNQTAPIKGYLDLHGHLRGTCKPFVAYAGEAFVLDWKTTGGSLDTQWKNRLMDSWQWRIYAHMTGAAMAIYRGVNREEETREVIIEVPQTNSAEVREYCEGGLGMRGALVQAGLTVWPRVMKKHSCEAFGRECPFWDDCRDYTMPRQSLPDKEMSFTQFERFFLCPEFHRRLILEPEADGGEESFFGTAVHRGMAEVYRQARSWGNGETREETEND